MPSAAGIRQAPSCSWPWDVEWALEDPRVNRVNVVGVVESPLLMDRLAANPEFKILLADHIHRHFHNGGALTREGATATDTWPGPMRSSGAIVGESARWGDVLRSQPYTRADWQAEVNRLVNQYFSGRTDTVLNQLKAKGWYPSVEAPAFQIDGKDQYGGQARSGAVLTMVNPNASGIIYYTLDGSDPRLPEEVSKQVPTVTLVAENAPKKVLGAHQGHRHDLAGRQTSRLTTRAGPTAHRRFRARQGAWAMTGSRPICRSLPTTCVRRCTARTPVATSASPLPSRPETWRSPGA